MFGEFKVVESRIITISTNSVVFGGLDFSEDNYQRFKIMFHGEGNILHQPSLVINDDTGPNYDLNVSTLAATYTSSNHPGQNNLVIGPGFTSNPAGRQEKLIMDVGVMYNGTSTKIFSKVFTNGSASGDIHYFDGVYTQPGTPTKIEFISDTGVAVGLFGVDALFERRKLSGVK